MVIRFELETNNISSLEIFLVSDFPDVEINGRKPANTESISFFVSFVSKYSFPVFNKNSTSFSKGIGSSVILLIGVSVVPMIT